MNNNQHFGDEELMHHYQLHQDKEAFSTLFTRYRVPVTSFICRLIIDRDEAESLAQEAFLRIIQKADSYQYPKRFSTWLYTIARNLTMDFLKKKKAIVIDDFHGLSGAILAPKTVEAEVRASHKEDLQHLTKAIKKLPLLYLEVIVLRALQGLSYSEIAKIVGCHESTARNRMDYGLQCLYKNVALTKEK